MTKSRYPLPEHDWEALMMRIIDSKYSDDESDTACECIEEIRNERAELVRRLEKKEKK